MHSLVRAAAAAFMMPAFAAAAPATEWQRPALVEYPLNASTTAVASADGSFAIDGGLGFWRAGPDGSFRYRYASDEGVKPTFFPDGGAIVEVGFDYTERLVRLRPDGTLAWTVALRSNSTWPMADGSSWHVGVEGPETFLFHLRADGAGVDRVVPLPVAPSSFTHIVDGDETGLLIRAQP